jgi:hypothetical protein
LLLCIGLYFLNVAFKPRARTTPEILEKFKVIEKYYKDAENCDISAIKYLNNRDETSNTKDGYWFIYGVLCGIPEFEQAFFESFNAMSAEKQALKLKELRDNGIYYRKDLMLKFLDKMNVTS